MLRFLNRNPSAGIFTLFLIVFAIGIGSLLSANKLSSCSAYPAPTTTDVRFYWNDTGDGWTYTIEAVDGKIVRVHLGARAAMAWRTFELDKNGKVEKIDAHNAHEEMPPIVSNEKVKCYLKKARALYKSAIKSLK